MFALRSNRGSSISVWETQDREARSEKRRLSQCTYVQVLVMLDEVQGKTDGVSHHGAQQCRMSIRRGGSHQEHSLLQNF